MTRHEHECFYCQCVNRAMDFYVYLTDTKYNKVKHDLACASICYAYILRQRPFIHSITGTDIVLICSRLGNINRLVVQHVACDCHG